MKELDEVGQGGGDAFNPSIYLGGRGRKIDCSGVEVSLLCRTSLVSSRPGLCIVRPPPFFFKEEERKDKEKRSAWPKLKFLQGHQFLESKSVLKVRNSAQTAPAYQLEIGRSDQTPDQAPSTQNEAQENKPNSNPIAEVKLSALRVILFA